MCCSAALCRALLCCSKETSPAAIGSCFGPRVSNHPCRRRKWSWRKERADRRQQQLSHPHLHLHPYSYLHSSRRCILVALYLFCSSCFFSKQTACAAIRTDPPRSDTDRWSEGKVQTALQVAHPACACVCPPCLSPYPCFFRATGQEHQGNSQSAARPDRYRAGSLRNRY